MELERTVSEGYPVGEIARIAGVTVRTLHHYDEIGLLSPGGRSPSGYRLYDDADLDRLERILFYRELGFPLSEIAAVLDEPSLDHAEHLRRQEALLEARIDRSSVMLAAVRAALEAAVMGRKMTAEERFEVFGDFDPDVYADEVEERWGGTDTFEESKRKTDAYSKDDWVEIKAEAAEIERRFAEAMKAGVSATDPSVLAVAEEHRSHISNRFYSCGYEIHRGLARMYVEDDRFRRHYEEIAPGLAAFVAEAIEENAARAESR